jgi:signal transduction histidine kinase
VSVTTIELPETRGGLRLPSWWRSGRRTRLWWVALASFCVFMSLDALAQIEHGGEGAGMFGIADAVVGETAETAVGLLFWMWRPRNIVGPLLVAYVQVSMLNDLPFDAPHSRLALTVGFLFNLAWVPLYLLMLLVFPNGRLWTRRARWFVAFTAALTLVQYLPLLLVGDLNPPSYFYLGHHWSGVGTWIRACSVVWFVWWFVLDAFLITRLVRATPGSRRRLAPLYLLVLVVLQPFYLYALYRGLEGQALPRWLWYPVWSWYFWSAVGAAFGLARVRRARGSVADLVVELGTVAPGRVREALARTLGDPTLVLGLWLPERGAWVDEQGRELALPEDGSRGVTYVGARLAVLVHDHDLLDQPRLLEAVGSAGRLALENERLQAELRAQLVELRESRARIVRTADDERRRLERDLHDGAQQRLLGIGMALQLLRTRQTDPGSIELLAEVEQELGQALAELRELARGIHPAVLTDHGLAAAVRTLAERAPVPVEVQACAERLPEPVETAAYFVVAEALANVAKYAHASHAWVRVAREDSTAVVEVRDDGVGGASSASGGSGLRGLADRVGALDGRLSVDSRAGGGTRVRAVIPCAS